MSWQTPRERDFRLGGPFLAKRTGDAGTLHLEDGQIYTHKQFTDAGVSDRILQRMYSAHWMDMAPSDETPVPLDRDGDGKAGGSLTDEEQLALGKAGFTLDEYLALADEHRADVLAKALEAAQEPQGEVSAPVDPETPVAGADGAPAATDEASGTGDGAEGTADAGDAPAATEDGAATGRGQVTAPAEPVKDTVVAAYKSFGFGKYWPINAANEKLGDKPMTKVDAEGLSGRDALPLLGQTEVLPPKE
jgi:hypothetical protein